MLPVAATAAPSQGGVVVLGANGRTGSECVKALIARNKRVVACTRSGADAGFESSRLLSTARCDVTVNAPRRAALLGAAALVLAPPANAIEKLPKEERGMALIRAKKQDRYAERQKKREMKKAERPGRRQAYESLPVGAFGVLPTRAMGGL